MSQFKVFLLLLSLGCPGLLIFGSILNIFKEVRHSPLELAPFVFLGGAAFTIVSCFYLMFGNLYSIDASKIFIRKRDKLGFIISFFANITSLTALFYYIWYHETWSDLWSFVLCFFFFSIASYIQVKQFKTIFKHEK